MGVQRPEFRFCTTTSREREYLRDDEAREQDHS